MKNAQVTDSQIQRTIHWSYVPTKPGESWIGYLWGDIVAIQAHESKATKPCPAWISDGQLACSLCVTGKPLLYKAYVPIIRESDGRPVLIVLNEYAVGPILKAQYGDRLLIMRGNQPGDFTAVVKAPTQKKYKSALPALQEPADIRTSLFRLWGKPDQLQQYILCESPSKTRGKTSSCEPVSNILRPLLERMQNGQQH